MRTYGAFDGGDEAPRVLGLSPVEGIERAGAGSAWAAGRAPVTNRTRAACAREARRAVDGDRGDAEEGHEGAPAQILIEGEPDAAARLQTPEQLARIVAIDERREMACATSIAQAIERGASAFALHDVDVRDRPEAGAGDLERDLMTAEKEHAFRCVEGRAQFGLSDHVQSPRDRPAIAGPGQRALEQGVPVAAVRAAFVPGCLVRFRKAQLRLRAAIRRRAGADSEPSAPRRAPSGASSSGGRASTNASARQARSAAVLCSVPSNSSSCTRTHGRPSGSVTAHVIVCGDVMLDRYYRRDRAHFAEAPVPVVRVDAEVLRPGGAANVAASLVALGARCTLVGVIGDDADGAQLERLLDEAGVGAD